MPVSKPNVSIDFNSFPDPPPEAEHWEPDPDYIPTPRTLVDNRFMNNEEDEYKEAAITLGISRCPIIRYSRTLDDEQGSTVDTDVGKVNLSKDWLTPAPRASDPSQNLQPHLSKRTTRQYPSSPPGTYNPGVHHLASDAESGPQARSRRSSDTTAIATLVNDSRETSIGIDDEEFAKRLSIEEMLDCGTESVAEALAEQIDMFKQYQMEKMRISEKIIDKEIVSHRYELAQQIIVWEQDYNEQKRVAMEELRAMAPDEFSRYFAKAKSAHHTWQEGEDTRKLFKEFQADEQMKFRSNEYKARTERYRGQEMKEADNFNSGNSHSIASNFNPGNRQSIAGNFNPGNRQSIAGNFNPGNRQSIADNFNPGDSQSIADDFEFKNDDRDDDDGDNNSSGGVDLSLI